MSGPRTVESGRRGRTAVWVAAAALFLTPLIAVQFTDEMNWTAFDFVVLAAMLIAAAGAYDLAARMTHDAAYRAATAIALVTAFLLVWINLAVGLVGAEDHPANLLYAGVLGVATIGAVVARFRAAGLAKALAATSIAQAAVGATALLAGWGSSAPSFPAAIAALTAIFFALWLLSAWLFRRSAQARQGTTA